ncbi:hypothetical protein BTO30_01445 [Domibacillus antri]|uniref:Uncharacterized protein n=1 Tax=Domibacillus antri TaxID=1714264 RepID=A0A1Q8Q9T0_9BACI|nr:hypothetical protein [Domibacillus antri]OLN24106.1 hypothetical protein BTO30_01445 [Domibacillus antri]
MKLFAAQMILLSLSLLYRPHFLYVFILLFLVWLLFWRKKELPFKTAGFFLIPVVFLFVNGLYNQSLHGQFVTLENYSGQNLYIANNPETNIRNGERDALFFFLTKLSFVFGYALIK